MTYGDRPITTDTPTIFAIDATVERMMRAITRQDAENLLPLDPADDDLIQERIRIRLGECRKMLAHWHGHGVDNGRYEIMGRPWISRDGIEWIDNRTGEPVDTEEFHNSSITMFGGPRDGVNADLAGLADAVRMTYGETAGRDQRLAFGLEVA